MKFPLVDKNLINSIGVIVLRPVESFGRFSLFVSDSVKNIFKPLVRWDLLLKQMEFVGSKSFIIIMLAGAMVGGIFGFQLGAIFKIFGAQSMMGAAATYTLSKELAPVVGAMLVTGRAGASMAAEIAIMRVNEQIDSMQAMAINPYGYLMAPRVAASVLMMPFLTAFFILSGVFTSYVIAVIYYDVSLGTFLERIRWVVNPEDIMLGINKSFVFGFLMAVICCYQGFSASGGAKGVGRATTKSVVLTFVVILISDFFLSYLQYRL